MWPTLSQLIDRAWIPTTYESPEKHTNLLGDILNCKAHVWVLYSHSRGVLAIVVTNFITDYYTYVRSLQIAALAAVQHIDNDAYNYGLGSLCKYAVANGCPRVVAYSADKRVLEMAQAFGANTSQHFIAINALKEG